MLVPAGAQLPMAHINADAHYAYGHVPGCLDVGRTAEAGKCYTSLVYS